MQPYGINDNSYQAAGQYQGIYQLVEEFYRNMAMFKESQEIFAMHPEDTQLSIKKLADFLSGWLGGPKLYAQNYGAIAIPRAHAHLPIGQKEHDAWLMCMKEAIAKQNYNVEFKTYLYEQLKVPASRILAVNKQS